MTARPIAALIVSADLARPGNVVRALSKAMRFEVAP